MLKQLCLPLAMALGMAAMGQAASDPFLPSLKGLNKLGVKVKAEIQEVQNGETTSKATLEEAQDDIRHSDLEGKLRDEGFGVLTPAEMEKNPLSPQMLVAATLRRGDLLANGALDKTIGLIEVSVLLLQPTSLLRDPKIKTLSITWMGRRSSFVKGLQPAKPDAEPLRQAVRSILADFLKAWQSVNHPQAADNSDSK